MVFGWVGKALPASTQNDGESGGTPLLHHVKVGLGHDLLIELKVGLHLEDMAFGIHEYMNPAMAWLVFQVVPGAAGAEPDVQKPVLEIEPVLYLDLPDFFHELEDHSLHTSPSI
jgi:hypothetical protein